jgi:zinc transporter ZupT
MADYLLDFSHGLHVVAACLLSGVSVVILATQLKLEWLQKRLPHLISLAAGLFLATACLHLIPEALELDADPHHTMNWFLFGLLLLFTLEKTAVLRHNHNH